MKNATAKRLYDRGKGFLRRDLVKQVIPPFLLIFLGEYERINTFCTIKKIEQRRRIDILCYRRQFRPSPIKIRHAEDIVISVTVAVDEQVLADDIDIGDPSYPYVDLVLILCAVVDVASCIP